MDAAAGNVMDSRHDILLSSRVRSGSFKFEDQENHPPDGSTEHDVSEAGIKTRKLGGNVHKMRDMFQAGITSGLSDGKMSGGSKSHNPPTSLAPPLITSSRTKELKSPGVSVGRNRNANAVSQHSESDKSPEVKRKKVSDGIPKVSKKKENFSNQIESNVNLLEATNHVQRFNYTRMMFARMEEETRIREEQERKIRARKHSPIRFNISPVLSPVSSSPVSPTAMKTFDQAVRQRTHSTDKDYRTTPRERFSRSSSLDQTSSDQSTISPRSDSQDSLENVLAEPNSKHISDSTSATSIGQPPPYNITASGLAWQRKMEQEKRADSSEHIPVDRSEVVSDGGSISQFDETESRFSSRQSRPRTRPVISEKPDLSIKSGYCSYNQKSSQVNQGLSDVHSSKKNDTNNSSDGDFSPSSVRMRHKGADWTKSGGDAGSSPADGEHTSVNSADSESSGCKDNIDANDYDDGGSDVDLSSVSMRPKTTRGDRNEAAVRMRPKKVHLIEGGKRLSREEIDSALERANAYLHHLSAVDEDDFRAKRRSWEVRQKRDERKRQSLDLKDSVKDGGGGDHGGAATDQRDSIPDLTRDLLDRDGEPFVAVDSHANSDSNAEQDATVTSNAFMRVSTSSNSTSTSDYPDMEDVTEIDTAFPASSTSRPTPVPRRTAPPPPSKPPSASRPSAPPPPAPAPTPGLSEESRAQKDDLDGAFVSLLGSLGSATSDVTGGSTSSEFEYIPPDDLLFDETSPESVLNSKKSDEIFLKRTEGDGHEDPDTFQCDFGTKDDFQEMPGLSDTDEGSSDDEGYEGLDLRKKTRVRFSKQPIKVFATYSTDDYDRRNEDIDPVAASAEYELEKRVEKMDVFETDIEKGSSGLGLSIIGMGVGADAGLEKLGIFIKTLTEGGSAQRDGRMQVNDQIIEVDGKSLVGVTQAYAASVLRNTSGHVRFLIGREKDPSKSEVARLIQQSLEQDRRRDELRRQEQERLRLVQEQKLPKDEMLEMEHAEHVESFVRQFSSEPASMDKGVEEPVQNEATSLDMVEEAPEAGETTPLSGPSLEDSSPSSAEDEGHVKPDIEVLDLVESSCDSISPDTESQTLYIKLKETHYKNAVAEAELAKLKAKIILLENSESQKKHLEKKCDDLTHRLKDTEKTLELTRKELSQYQDLMEGSQGQYIMLEKKIKADFTALEKKYHKAKKLIKDYQGREKDFIQERESLLQQQSEKDQQYNALVKSLKDRIFQLERDLIETQKAAGLPVSVPNDTTHKEEVVITQSSVPLIQSVQNGHDESFSPMNQSTDRISETSSGSEHSEVISAPDIIHDIDESKVSRVSNDQEEEFGSVPTTTLLDTSVNKMRAQLASNIGSRRPPSKRSKSSECEADTGDTDSLKQEGESGLETWIKHDRLPAFMLVDSTVRKSDAKKRRGQQVADAQHSPRLPAMSQTSASSGPSSVAESDTVSEQSSRSVHDSHSDTSSSVSQTSYDPLRPQFKHMDGEIPDSTASSDSSGAITLVSAKPSTAAKGFGLPKFSLKPKSSEDSGGGIVLLSSRALGSKQPTEKGGIILLSKKPIDHGYSDFEDESTTSDVPSSLMVSELDEKKSSAFSLNISGTPAAEENVVPNKRSQNQFQSCPIPEWNVEHVCHWLMALELEKYTPLFKDKSITGSQLLTMDGSKFKTLGIVNSKDRELLKKKVKELRLAIEKEKKQQEKERKAREKEQKKLQKKK
ncbi:uncharacterized protein LOC121387389 isoform X2 [Gigantopelta aegis]|uniref:uncharacterized protein LOC121387389 isoform X2 n=1 Tax=Gigantopelta aegis TaxID=1735272 RepID=UPI001B88AC50|nr:uncharacterized protein LOC121387389 isoform X2 [Gigantopelta aegis]